MSCRNSHGPGLYVPLELELWVRELLLRNPLKAADLEESSVAFAGTLLRGTAWCTGVCPEARPWGFKYRPLFGVSHVTGVKEFQSRAPFKSYTKPGL